MRFLFYCKFFLVGIVLILSLDSSAIQNKRKTKQKKKQVRQVKTKLVQPNFAHPPYAIVYKTKADYTQLVPLRMDDSLKEIISYLHPTDLSKEGKFLTPLKLNNGYLLDRQGIGSTSVFLKYTYSNYSKFTKIPTLDSLNTNILIRNPFLEIWNCGCMTNYTSLKLQLDAIISADSLSKKCRPIFIHLKVD